jgi:hypothetical protein
MRRLDIPGAWYSEALTSGAYCALFPGSHVRTHLGEFPLPDGSDNPLYLRCTDASVFKMAGQSHGGKGTWEWSAGEWRIVGSSFGVNPHIYDGAGRLHLATDSHQGFRYVRDDGTFATGDETYADPARRIGEYTVHGDLVIGQSGFSCQALYQGQRYVLASGSARNIIFNRDGNACAVAIHLEGWGTRLLWFDVSELAQFPLESQPEPEPKPKPKPEPEPAPQPMRLTDAQLISLRAERDALNKETLTKEEGGALLNRWAWKHRNDPNRIGLQRDESDPRCYMPDGTPIWAGARMIVDGKHYGGDVMVAATVGRFEPNDADFLPADADGPNGRVEPIDPGDVPDQPPPIDLTQRVADLEARANVQGMALQEAVARMNLMQAEMAAIKAKLDDPRPPPTYESIYVSVRAGSKTYAGTLPVEG